MEPPRVLLIDPKAVTGGTYILESSELRVARLCFRWNHRTIPSNSPCLREQPVLVRVPKDLLALNVQLTQPTRGESSFVYYDFILYIIFSKLSLQSPRRSFLRYRLVGIKFSRPS